MSVYYQYRDNLAKFTVTDSSGVVIPASSFMNAQFRIFPVGSCTPEISKSLGSGIVVSGDDFEVDIADTEMTFSGTDGEYKHVFVVGYTADEVLPSVVDQVVDIIPGCPL